MSFVTTQPEALVAAADTLQTIGTSMAAQNAASAGATTGVAPAAADSVSALQAAQFSAYGTWYQQVSERAAAVHQMLVNTLGSNAGSYGQAESTNQTSAGSTSLSGLLSGLTGSGASATSGAAAPSAPTSSTGAAIGTPFNYLQNVGAAASDFIALGQGQFLPGAVSWDPAGAGAAAAPGIAPGPIPVAAAPAASIGAPVSAGLGQASALNGLSVPPGWTTAAAAGPPVTPHVAIAGSAAPIAHPAQVGAVPGGVPSVASAGRGGLGFGAPRYGVKPTVMPRPAFV